MKRELDTIKGASKILQPGYHITQTVMGATRVYKVTNVDQERDKVWGAWVDDADSDRWWTMNEVSVLHPAISNETNERTDS